MSETLYLKNKRLVIDPNRLIGSGGEGDVWDIGGGLALKVFKTHDHPDYAGSDPQSERDREGARLRLEALQKKLPVFPKLPERVIAPQDLVLTKQGLVRGYTMRFLQGGEVLKSFTRSGFRNSAGVDNNAMQGILLDLFDLVSSVHQRGTQIGDFNILGVLVLNGVSYLIDADSFQFGGFMCRSFTPRFVDPTLCKKDEMVLAKDFSEASDWYSFAMMAFETLTYVTPYGGVLKGPLAKTMTQDERPLRRVSVLHKDVTYPAKGTPLDRLSDDFLHYYEQLLHKDVRGTFPRGLFEKTRWHRCGTCGIEHTHRSCPGCKAIVPSASLVEVRRGRLVLTTVFKTEGRILNATADAGKPRYLYWRDGAFYREGDRLVTRGDLSAKLKTRILGDTTAFSQGGGVVATMSVAADPVVRMVDSYRDTFPVFDTNGKNLFWISSGRILRDGELGEKFLSRSVPGQTLLWTGPKFGLGTYRVGQIRHSFVFDADTGVQREVSFPRPVGDPLDATCYFTPHACWFFIASNERGDIMHDCFVIRRDGTIAAHERAKEGDGSWLDSFMGKTAISLPKGDGVTHALLSVGDAGMCRIEEQNGSLVETTRWSDTQGVLRPTDLLVPSSQGILVVRNNEILLAKLT